MAIKISSTEVITDGRALINIAGGTGNYSNFHAVPVDITDNINFTTPIASCTLTQNTTFTSSGAAAGKSAMLLLDLSTNGYTPTWPSEVNWKDNTEPTWSGYRYWLVQFYVVSGTEYRASAIGYSSAASPPTEAVTLEGTTSTPISFYDASAGLDDLVMGWTFDSNGNVYKYENIYNVGGNGTYLYSTTTWNNITPSKTYYIRVSNFSGNNLSVGDSATLNDWISLLSTRTFRYRDARAISSYGAESGTMKVEIAELNFGTEQYSASAPLYYAQEVGYTDGEGFPDTYVRIYWNGTAVVTLGMSGAGSTTSTGDNWVGNDGNIYKVGSFVSTTGSPATDTYKVYQGTYNILATGYYKCEWAGTA